MKQLHARDDLATREAPGTRTVEPRVEVCRSHREPLSFLSSLNQYVASVHLAATPCRRGTQVGLLSCNKRDVGRAPTMTTTNTPLHRHRHRPTFPHCTAPSPEDAPCPTSSRRNWQSRPTLLVTPRTSTSRFAARYRLTSLRLMSTVAHSHPAPPSSATGFSRARSFQDQVHGPV